MKHHEDNNFNDSDYQDIQALFSDIPVAPDIETKTAEVTEQSVERKRQVRKYNMNNILSKAKHMRQERIRQRRMRNMKTRKDTIPITVSGHLPCEKKGQRNTIKEIIYVLKESVAAMIYSITEQFTYLKRPTTRFKLTRRGKWYTFDTIPHAFTVRSTMHLSIMHSYQGEPPPVPPRPDRATKHGIPLPRYPAVERPELPQRTTRRRGNGRHDLHEQHMERLHHGTPIRSSTPLPTSNFNSMKTKKQQYDHSKTKIVVKDLEGKSHEVSIPNGTKIFDLFRKICEELEIGPHMIWIKWYSSYNTKADWIKMNKIDLRKTIFYNMVTEVKLDEKMNPNADHCHRCGALGGGGCKECVDNVYVTIKSPNGSMYKIQEEYNTKILDFCLKLIENSKDLSPETFEVKTQYGMWKTLDKITDYEKIYDNTILTIRSKK